jgi:hypothetical protein
MGELLVDFVAKDPWQMVLVEESPWTDLSTKLARVQDRQYGCLDAAIDGQLAEKFPGSSGQLVTVRLDCYSAPRAEVEAFFNRFRSAVLDLPDYKVALAKTPHVSGVQLAINFD